MEFINQGTLASLKIDNLNSKRFVTQKGVSFLRNFLKMLRRWESITK